MFATERQQTSYICSAYGGPDKVFIWMIDVDGIVIEYDNQYDISTEMINLTSNSSELTILSVDVTNKGNYSCQRTLTNTSMPSQDYIHTLCLETNY